MPQSIGIVKIELRTLCFQDEFAFFRVPCDTGEAFADSATRRLTILDVVAEKEVMTLEGNTDVICDIKV